MEGQIIQKPPGCSTKWLTITFAFLSLVYIFTAYIPIALYLFGLPGDQVFYHFGSALCHQKPSSCFWLNNAQTALCGKCIGVYTGFALSLALSLFISTAFTKHTYRYGLIIFVCMAFHSLTDHFFGVLKFSAQENFIFGLLAGAGVGLSFTHAKRNGGPVMQFLSRRWGMIASLCILINIVGFAMAYAQQPAQAGSTEQVITIPAGTAVILEIETAVTTKESREGDPVPMHVVAPIRIKDQVVIRGGVPARGRVGMSQSASAWGGAGELVIEAKTVPAIDGTDVLVSGSTGRRGETSHGTSAAVAVGTGLICLPLALTGAAVKGEEGRVRIGHEVIARTLNDHPVRILPEEEQKKIALEQNQLAEKQRLEAEAQKRREEEEEARKKKMREAQSY